MTLPAEAGNSGLWLAVIGIGLYHGANPGMGWPLAVSAGLMGKGRRDLLRALYALAAGHFLAMSAIMLPFAALAALAAAERQIRIGAGLLVMAAGIYLLINRRHPRFLARINPAQLMFWSFAAATAHGAGLMLVPIYLGLCRAGGTDASHEAAFQLMGTNFITAMAVAAVHTLAMIIAGGIAAVVVYEWLGVQYIAKSWFNLDAVWALSLVLVGLIGIASALASA